MSSGAVSRLLERLPPGTKLLTLDELLAQNNRLRLEAQREMAAERIATRLANSGVPPIFASTTFADYEVGDHKGMRTALEASRRYASSFAERLAGGWSMAFLGASGCGKSMLASTIVQTVNAAGHHAVYATVSDVLRAVRETFDRGSPLSEGQVLQRYSSPHLLVLDEVGRHACKPHDLQRLFEIVDYRASRRLPMIVISNLSEVATENLIGPAAWERLMGRNGFVVQFDWPSYRRQIKAG